MICRFNFACHPRQKLIPTGVTCRRTNRGLSSSLAASVSCAVIWVAKEGYHQYFSIVCVSFEKSKIKRGHANGRSAFKMKDFAIFISFQGCKLTEQNVFRFPQRHARELESSRAMPRSKPNLLQRSSNRSGLAHRSLINKADHIRVSLETKLSSFLVVEEPNTQRFIFCSVKPTCSKVILSG